MMIAPVRWTTRQFIIALAAFVVYTVTVAHVSYSYGAKSSISVPVNSYTVKSRISPPVPPLLTGVARKAGIVLQASTVKPGVEQKPAYEKYKRADLDNNVKINIIDVNKLPNNNAEKCIPLRDAVHHEKICIDTKDKFIGLSIERHGAWEPHIFNVMKKILDADVDRHLIDIGANIGVYTILVASRGRRVIAVEAFWENVLRLSQSIRLGKLQNQVTVIHNAVSNVYEEVTFWRPGDNPGGTHTYSKDEHPEDPVHQIIYKGIHDSVATIQIDNLLKVIPFKKAVFKIDIEGFEAKAMIAMTGLLDTMDISHIFMEWSPVAVKQQCMQIVDMLVARGYKAHSLNLSLLPGHAWPAVRQWPHDIIWKKVR